MGEAFRPDDELVSAVLDGEATPEERARVLADPVLAARLAEFEAVAGAVGGPVAPRPAAARDSSLAAAAAARPRPDPVVRPLRPRRSPGPLLAAAAVLALVVGAGLLLSRAGDDTDGDDSAALQEPSDGAGDEAETSAEEAAAPEADAFDAAVDAGDLGALADPDAVALALEQAGAVSRDTADAEARPAPATDADGQVLAEVPGGDLDCQIALEEADPALAGLLARATATYQGTPAVVLVFSTVDGTQRVVVVTADACRPLTTFDL